jgi:pimeloyl-ACP methyl ester carboxylesterase
MLILSAILLACLVTIFIPLAIWSYPGSPRPFLDGSGNPLPHSVSEKISVTINGVRQGMIIKSRDTAHPVLLYIHGGMPEYFLTQDYPVHLEDHFTVVWWEQRGSGLSWSPDIPPSTLTGEQLISDLFSVTDYLRRRFGKEKIYLMAHSGGTFIGIQAAALRPDLFAAYIGIAQVSHQLRSEVRAYDYMLAQFRKQAETPMVRKLEAAPVSLSAGVPDAYLAVRDDAMHRLGVGTTRDITSVPVGIFLRSLRCREYTIGEKINLWRGKAASGVATLWREMISTDLTSGVRDLAIPVYFFHGVEDYTVSYVEAKSYFDLLRAPVRGFYSFGRSAHSPIFEEPDVMLRIMLEDVLAGTTNLADPSGSGTRRGIPE